MMRSTGNGGRMPRGRARHGRRIAEGRRCYACRRGTITIDFAMVALTLVMAMIACIDIGRYVATRTALRNAMAEVLRAAMTDATLVGVETPKAHALSRVSMLDPMQFAISVERLPAGAPTTSVRVSASYGFSFITPLFGAQSRALTPQPLTTPI
jgi:Flp pilus assembly protein TadG